MNIVLYVHSFLPSVGGRELVVHHLATSLLSLGHRVRVVGPAGWRSHCKLRFDYPVHRWPTLRGLFSDELAFMQLLLDTSIWGCDVIHAHSTYPSGYSAARLKNIKNIPMVITPHGEDIHTIPEIGFGQRLDPIQRPKIARSLQSADLLTAISASVEVSLLNAGAPQDKIRKVPNGVDLERFQRPVEADVREWLQLPAESRLIVTVGNYHPRKGHEVLIRSMPHILESQPFAHLIIVGRNSDELRPLIRELNLERNIRLTGPIDFPSTTSKNGASQDSNKPDWLAAIHRSSELYVSAGLEEGAEGLSLALLEAMSAGLPVVATDISGNRDIVQNGENGILISPSDHNQMSEAVLRLLATEESIIFMGRKAREIANQYQWIEVAGQYLEVYGEAQKRNRENSP